MSDNPDDGLTVTVAGKPGRLAVLDEDGHIIAEGDEVAREAEFVVVNAYRDLLIGKGLVRPLDGDQIKGRL